MKFDTPATTNPIDQLKVVGQPTDRIDGPLKTTGTAPYAYERHDVVAEPGLWLRRRLGDRQGSDRVDGSRLPPRPRPACSPSSRPRMPASSARANSTRRSCSAAPRSSTTTRPSRSSSPRPSSRRAPPRSLIRVDYERDRGAFDLAAAKDAAAKPQADGSAARRIPRSAISPAPSRQRRCKLDATYTTPDQAHAMMEPHATIAAWDGDKLTLWTSNQMIAWGAADLAKTLGIAEGERPPHLAVHRRRLRRQAVPARRRAAGGARRARGRAAGEGGAARGR